MGRLAVTSHQRSFVGAGLYGLHEADQHSNTSTSMHDASKLLEESCASLYAILVRRCRLEGFTDILWSAPVPDRLELERRGHVLALENCLRHSPRRGLKRRSALTRDEG